MERHIFNFKRCNSKVPRAKASKRHILNFKRCNSKVRKKNIFKVKHFLLSPFSIFYASTCLLFAQYKRDISHFASFSWCIFYLLRELRSRSSVAPCVPLLGPVLPRLWPGASLDRFFLPLFLAFLLALRLFPFFFFLLSCLLCKVEGSRVQGSRVSRRHGLKSSRVQTVQGFKGPKFRGSQEPKVRRSERRIEGSKSRGSRCKGPRSEGPEVKGPHGSRGARVQEFKGLGSRGARVQAFKGARDPRKGPKVRGLKGPRIQGSQGSKVQRSEG